MLSFRINDTYLDYNHEGSIGYRYTSSFQELFNSAGDRSYSLSFPMTPKNDHIFDHAKHAYVYNDYRSYACAMLFNGIERHYGQLVLFQAGQSYECYYYSNKSFNIGSKQTKLIDITSLDQIVTIGTTSAEVAEYAIADHSDIGICFPTIYSTEFYGENNPSFYGFINPKALVPASQNLYVNSTAIDGPINAFAFMPCLLLSHLVDACCEHIGLRPIGDLFLDPLFINRAIESNFPLDSPGGEDYITNLSNATNINANATPTLINFTDNTGSGYTGTDTYDPPLIEGGTAVTRTWRYYTVQDDGSHLITVNAAHLAGYYTSTLTNKKKFNSTLQTIYLKVWRLPFGESESILAHVWDITASGAKLQADSSLFDIWESYSINANVNDQIFFEVEAVKHNMSSGTTSLIPVLVWELNLSIQNSTSENLNVYSKSFNKLDLLPDATINDLFDSIKIWYGCTIVIDSNNGTITFNLINNILRAANTIDYSDKLIGRPSIDFSQRSNLSWAVSDSEESRNSYRYPISQDNSYQSIVFTPKFGMLPKDDEYRSMTTDLNHERRQLGISRANSAMFNQDNEQAPLRFIWAGDSGNLLSYPEFIFARYNQLFAKYFSGADKVNVQLKLSLTDLELVDFNTIVIINHVAYFIMEINVAYNKNYIGISSVELIRINAS